MNDLLACDGLQRNMEQGVWSRASYLLWSEAPTAPNLSAPADNTVVRRSPTLPGGSVRGDSELPDPN